MKRFTRFLWPAAVLALPLTLLLSSLLTFRELRELTRVYLRNRAAVLAARLETLPPGDLDAALAALEDEEPALAGIRIFAGNEPGPDAAALEPLWSGQQLFKTEELQQDGERIFRAYIPFHWQGRTRIARIDLAASAADFLVRHARHNVMVASVSGLVLLLLSLYALWSARRNARLERQQLELEHLAHLGKMSAVLAHEIRNPLGTIKGFAQLAGEKADAAVNALLGPVVEEVGRLEKLVNDLLMYGRPPEPVARPTEWQAMTADIAAYARQAIGDRAIRFSSAPAELRLRTDPHLLKQILLNLVRNAVEALGDDPGEVRLGAGRDGGALTIWVEDDGPGMPEQVRAKLFEPFFTTKATGTGLGLPIARKLATALGARLELRPAEPRGTRVELIFPRVELETGVPAWQPSL